MALSGLKWDWGHAMEEEEEGGVVAIFWLTRAHHCSLPPLQGQLSGCKRALGRCSPWHGLLLRSWALPV